MDFYGYSDAVVELNKWGVAYANGSSLVDDATYDALYKQIKLFEATNPSMIDPDSPTMKVHSDATDGFAKANHSIHMGSIANSNGIDELSTWTHKTAGNGYPSQVIEYKIDGLALSLIYDNGVLVNAITRGDGTTGDVVLVNALRIPSIPKTIPTDGVDGKILEVRGECVWYKENFEAYNKWLTDLGQEPMSNPRNGAAGSLKSKDPNELDKRKLDFIAYRVVQGSQHDLHSQDLAYLKSIGFTVSEHYVCPTPQKVVDGCEFLRNKRHELPFLIDGCVVKVDDKTKYDDIGGTVKSPHWCTAYKFPPEEKATKLLGIEESYGRLGAVTPVAILEEVELALTKVRRASLHNWDVVDFLGLHIGCTVVVRKAGEIIPEIVRCVETNRTKEQYETLKDGTLKAHVESLRNSVNYDWYLRPRTCSHCNSTLQHMTNNSGDSLVAWGCVNPQCSVKQYENIVKFCSKDAMNIYGVGPSTVEQMLSIGVINDICDLYGVDESELMRIDGFGTRSASLIVSAIAQSKTNTMDRLIVGFGIPNVGRSVSAIINSHYKELSDAVSASVSDLVCIGVGPDAAQSFVTWVNANKRVVEFFIMNSIADKGSVKQIDSDKLKGLTLIMTGTFDDLPRDEFKELVEKNGGKVASSISKNVSVVLLGDGAGPSKRSKIDEINTTMPGRIKVIGSAEFREMLK